MMAAIAHEVAKRERQIEQQEREIERLMNICSTQANDLTRARTAAQDLVRKAIYNQHSRGFDWYLVCSVEFDAVKALV